jgi:hypothetical protein
MTLRGRGSSPTPERSVEKLADLAGVDVPGGDEDARSNRVEGLGALLGMITGVTMGVAWAVVDDLTDGVLERLPVPTSGVLVGATALLGANGPMVALGVTDPRGWALADWVSDLLPHLAYGLVVAVAYQRPG